MEDNKEAIPERFVGVVTEEEYKKSINYNTERIRFSMLTALISVGVLLLFTTGGLLNSLTKVVQGGYSVKCCRDYFTWVIYCFN